LDFQVAVDSGGSDWLTAEVSSASAPRLLSITADPTNLAPGSYTGTVTIIPLAATPEKLTVNVTFQVEPAVPPQLSIDKLNLSFTYPRGAAVRSEAIRVSNSGGGSLNFSVA